jgi:hypothetical protein
MTRYRVACRSLFLVASTCLLASPALRPPVGNVLIVDAGGGGHYSTIQSAVDAAIDGDVLLVMAGTYSSFLITNKALTVVADTSAIVQVQGGIRIHDLALPKTVVIADLATIGVDSPDEGISTGLFLSNNQGHVRIQGCRLSGGSGPGGNAVTVTSGWDLSLVACTLEGGFPDPLYSSDGGRGLMVSGSLVVSVYGCSIRGRDGVDRDQYCSVDGGDGGDGGNVTDTFLFSSRSSFRGGEGGDAGGGSVFSPPAAGDGGDGIRATTSAVYLLDSETVGGLGGVQVGYTCGSFAWPGYAGLDRGGSAFTDVAGSARTMVSPSLAIAGTTEFVTVRGQPGDEVALFVSSTTTMAQYVPAWHGMLLIPLRTAPIAERALFLGTVPGSGVINFLLSVPDMPQGTPSRTLFFQALFRDTQGQRFLSGGRSMTILH